MQEIGGALFCFLIAAAFLTAAIMGARAMYKSKKEKHPFGAVSFGFGLPTLFACLSIAALFGWMGIEMIIK